MPDALCAIDGGGDLLCNAGYASWRRGIAVAGSTKLRILPRLYRARARFRLQGWPAGGLSYHSHSRLAWLLFQGWRNGHAWRAGHVALLGKRGAPRHPRRVRTDAAGAEMSR